MFAFLQDLQELRAALRSAGAEPAKVDAAIVHLVEDVDFSDLIPGPIGVLVEAVDDPLAKLGLAAKVAGLLGKKERVRKKDRRANQPDPEDAPTEDSPGN